MPGAYGTPIVEAALKLGAEHPHWTAMTILDQVMEAHRGTHPDFECGHPEFDDWLQPPSAFAELLRRAFDPEIRQADLQLMVTARIPAESLDRAKAIEARWQKVIDTFAKRYALWT